MIVSIIKPVEGLRFVQVKAPDGYRVRAPINEDIRGGVQKAEAFARAMMEKWRP